LNAMKPILLLSILLLSACASVKNEVQTPENNAAIKELTSYARSLVGVPYKYGGNSPDSGFDCSGFVGHVFRHTLGIKLPRSSVEISHVGQIISKRNLRAGDLVFFNKFSHVGIYLDDDRFIHAPSSGGSVRTENMHDAYWKKHYNGARRITLQS
jgi:cell wall-associated NlpC family hydrolase